MAPAAEVCSHERSRETVDEILKEIPGTGTVAMDIGSSRFALTYCPNCLCNVAYLRQSDGTTLIATVAWKGI